jgi:hypothetical protein
LQVRIAAALALACALSAGSALAYPDGPPDGFAGNPPSFMSCVLCHGDFDVNSGDGGLEILGLPSAYAAGATYDLMVRLRDPDQIRWGFELTVMGPGDLAAGSLTVTDATNTQLSDNPGTDPDFLKQTLTGTQNGTPDGPVTWSFKWTAPSANTATFYVAGNAANANEAPDSDYVYTLVQSLEQATVGAAPSTWSAMKSLYRR